MFVKHSMIKTGSIESREYQVNIAKKSIEQNTLVVAPTALGKTVIAVLLAAEFLKLHPEKKILILAPTRPLAAQHMARFRDFLNLDESKINLLTGHTKPSTRAKIWMDSHVISATPHTVLNDVRNGEYTLDDVSLVIFDEAHRAVGEYPYCPLAEKINSRILALTASPGGDIKTISAVKKRLKIKAIEIRDETDRDVSNHIKGIKVEWKKITLPEPYWVIRNLFLNLLRERLKQLKREGVISRASTEVSKKDFLDLMASLKKKVSSGGHKELFPSISAVSGCMTILHAVDLLETQGIAPLHDYLKRTELKAKSPKSSKAIQKLVASRDFKRAVSITNATKEQYSDPKIEALKEIISKSERDTKIIIFTQYRDTVKEIIANINQLDGVRAVRFIGQAHKRADPGMSQKKQLETLDEFKKGVYNVLVATSVAEEGLDIPSVDLVIFYEPVPSEIRMIQRRGRTGRTRMGQVIVLMAAKTRDESFYWSSIAKEKRMKKSLRTFKNQTLD